MKTLRRIDIRNRYYFVTIVTYERKPILVDHSSVLWRGWDDPKPMAWVILPDHLHFILFCESASISQRVHQFKITFSRWHRDRVQPGRVWQNRFWDHVLRDRDDFIHHLDYIHYNPVRHGLVASPEVYPLSSFRHFQARGYYDEGWRHSADAVSIAEYGE